MAAMSQTWSILTAVTVLAVQLCMGEKSCVIWSSAGSVVQRGSSFKVYCTFNCKCRGHMYSDHPPRPQSYRRNNSTTIHVNVMNITKNRTFSCHCQCVSLDPCGLDISAGYPPDYPKNISCIYKVKSDENGVVFCTWNKGQDTYLRDTRELRVRSVFRNHTVKELSHSVSGNGADFLSASFSASSSVQLISVWVHTHNALGAAESDMRNYTLSDIVMPSSPVLGRPECSSRQCIIKVEQFVRTQHLEIQCRAEQHAWTANLDPGVQMSSVQVISSLEPHRLYHFRARSKFSTGLWSQWSSNISSWTQEEAPARELDVWYARPASDGDSLRVYWKAMDVSVTRGRIMDYTVRVRGSNAEPASLTRLGADARNYSVSRCAGCEVTVRARNSKGLSPPATITTQHTRVPPTLDLRVVTNNDSVALSWYKPATATHPAAHVVVEWYPQGHKLQELRWVRLGGSDTQVVITDVEPFECYEGAVHVLYNDSSVMSTSFGPFNTMMSAPTGGPSVQERVDGNMVTVSWTELPRDQRGGCITNYTIYVENSTGYLRRYSVRASQRTYVIRSLSSADYSMWMTAMTAQGEGTAGQKVKFYIAHTEEMPTILLIVSAVICLLVLFLVHVCQLTSVKQRIWVYFQCFALDVVPDPANSKWAKECIQEKGRMSLQLQLSNESVTEEEDDPILVDVEELPKQTSETSAPTEVCPQLLPQTSQRPETPSPYPLTPFIKSLSQDSDSSDHTHTSLETNITVDYISSQDPGNLAEDEEEEDEEEFADAGFFPSHGVFMEPLAFGGKLTLDAVRIGCGDFFHEGS